MDSLIKNKEMIANINSIFKKVSFALILTTIFSIGSLAQVRVLSLNECINIGLKNHPDYQNAVLNAELASNEVARAKSNWLPEMNIGMSQGTNIGRSIDRFTNAYINDLYNSTFAQASLQQSVFQSFRVRHLVDANELSKLSGEQLTEAMKNNLSIRIIQAYLQVLQAQELSKMADNQLVASTEQADLVQLQVDAGTLAARELLQIQTQKANDEFTAKSLKGQTMRAELGLLQLLNLENDQAIRIEQLDQNMTFDSSLENNSLALNNLPEIKAADLQIRSFDSQLKSVKAQNLPSLFFFANYSTFYASSNPEESFFAQLNGARNGSISLGLNIPLFGKLQTSPQTQSLKIQQRIAQNQLRTTKLQVNQAYKTSLQNYEIALEQYKTAQKQAEIGQENLNAVVAQLEAGTINSSDYILARTNLERANSNLIQSKYGFMLEQKIIAFYQTGSWGF